MVTTTNKGLAEPANGDLSWDVPLNANFEAIDKAFGSSVTISLTGLSTYAVSAAQAQNMSLNFSGTPSSGVAVTLPTSVGGQWVVRNGTTRGLTVSSLSGGAGTVTVPTGTIRSIYCDGTNVFFADSQSSGTDDEIAYTSDGVLTGSPDLTFDGAELSVGASASITSWTTGSGTFTAIFSANKLIPVGSSVTFSGVSTTPASPNGFNSAFEVTASTQASGASTVTITATGVGSSPVGGTISYGNLKIGGSEVTATAEELNVLDGITGVSSQAQAEAGTDNATLMTPLRVKQSVEQNALSLGVGQTWQVPSRAIGTVYQNTTGRPIFIAVGASATSTTNLQVSVDGTNWVDVGNLAGFGNVGDTKSASTIVPNNSYYRATGGTLYFWSELR